jgi:hypothetical protein
LLCVLVWRAQGPLASDRPNANVLVGVDEDRMEIGHEGMIEEDRGPIRALPDQVAYLKKLLGILTEELTN